MKRLVVDLDGTLTQADTNNYPNVLPRFDVIEQLKNYKNQGFDIVITTARNMRTFEGNVGKINIHTQNSLGFLKDNVCTKHKGSNLFER